MKSSFWGTLKPCLYCWLDVTGGNTLVEIVRW